ncbi:hypothetical protein GCM10011452_14880 [Gemmobacter lanyuensis]|uniref:Magnesium transporter n=1 Tax=Gemmobacter lanyuensis TaxID=1054497 RepID=A0A918MJC6_9RHOB|nr:CorA family divalent cation transporter [Gemmobacter lanyuensis]GGW27419.1 hypothetical protein GCM10011452_14880 [Gemmobacter lanyuensis]
MHLDSIHELLRKQKMIEGMVRSQSSPASDDRQALVEAVVQRQHLAELEAFLARMPVSEIASLLEGLPAEEAQLLWQRVPESRASDVVWEVSDARREELLGVRALRGQENRINAFELEGGRIRQRPITSRRDLQGLVPVWIDLVRATPAERAYVGEHFGVPLPDPGEETDLEVSSRFQLEESGAIHLHSNFLLDRVGGDARSVPVAFVLKDGVLFSLRNEELPVFRLQRRRVAALPGHAGNAHDLLLNLYGADVEYSADSLEDIYKTLSRVGRHVLSETMTDKEAASVLADIAEEEDLNGRIRANIMDSQRALAFLMQARVLDKDQVTTAKQVLRNIESLNSHTAFLFDKINFLMDATIGFININQNQRVSQLTVLSVVFMPVNILAGMGGMSEFTMMTDGIPWPVAYGAFGVAAALLGGMTYIGLRWQEARKLRRRGGAKG